jgi:hypothetical protein
LGSTQSSAWGAGYFVGFAIPRLLGEYPIKPEGIKAEDRLSLEEVFVLFEKGYGVK